MERLDSLSLRSGATRILNAEIISGGLQPGQLYAIGEVAGRLGVSATPVREALLDLRTRGLIEMVRNRGFRIRDISDEELDQLLTVRLMVEVPAMTQLAAMDPQPDLAEAWARCELVLRAGEAGDLAGFLTADRDLHVGLTALVGNAPLADVIGNLRDRTRLYGLQNLSIPDITASAKEHFSLVEAIAARDAEKTALLMAAHLRHVRSDWAARPGPAE